MSTFVFIGSIFWGLLAAQFLVQAILSFAVACVYLYAIFFSRVKKQITVAGFTTSLAQAMLFGVLFIGGFWLFTAYVRPDVNWTACVVAFSFSFVYCVVQMPDKILVARLCAMKPPFAEAARAHGSRDEVVASARKYKTDNP